MVERVRVTGPPRHVPARRTASRLGDVHDQTPVGDVFLSSLLREQFGLALRILLALVLLLGSVPLAFHLFPSLSDLEVAGLPLAWVLLGGVAYPVLLLLAWRYVRRAEHNERVFSALVWASDPDRPDEDGRD